MPITLSIQEPITVLDYVGSIANGASYTGSGVPVIGLTLVYGMVYSTRQVTVYLWQGVNETTGAYLYRHVRSFVVAAGTAEQREYGIASKYCRIIISNASGFPADVEAFFCARAYE